MTPSNEMLASRLARISLVALAVLSGGCSKQTRPYTSKEAVDALTTLSGQVKTMRGRAWVSLKTPEQKISFPAVIAMDRTDPKNRKLRIEAIDPLGATHGLMILHQVKGKGKLTVIDFDNRQIQEVSGNWYGLPVDQLPDLLIGLAPIPEHGRVGAANPDGFEVRVGTHSFDYLMTWIDPGPRLALQGIASIVTHSHHSQKYLVRYSKYLDVKDLYLPRELLLRSFSSADAKESDPTLEIAMSWRERKWNEEIPGDVFNLPSGDALKGFKRE